MATPDVPYASVIAALLMQPVKSRNSPSGNNRMWAGGSMPPAHEDFPPRHTTAAGRAPVRDAWAGDGLGGSSGLIVKERTV